MFEKGTIKSTYDQPLNLGLLLEMLLFYKQINIVVNTKSLESLLEDERTLKIVTELVERKTLEIYMLRANHSLSGFSGRYSVKLWDIEEFEKIKVYDAINAVLTKKNISKSHENLVDNFCKLIRPFSLNSDMAPIYNDIFNSDYLKSAIKSVIISRFPKLKDPENQYYYEFEEHTTSELGKGFFLNIKFSTEIEKGLTQHDLWMLGGEPIVAIIDTYNSIDISKRFMSDFSSDSIYKSLLTKKVIDISDRLNFNADEDLKIFQDLVIENSRSVKDAINSGNRTIDDYYKLYNKSEKFKQWLINIPPDKQLIKEYLEQITKDNWFDGLPTKSVRWCLFTGAGLAIDAMGAGGLGTMAGLALSATDTFVLDGLIKGWKPNLFIDDISKFTST